MQEVMSRPYVRDLTAELDSLFQEHSNDLRLLMTIAHELGFRRRQYARKLKDEVTERIETLKSERFAWPSTEAKPGTTALTDTDWPQESPLKRLGYAVGMNGQSETARRRMLQQAFKGSLPNVFSAAYMAEWGRPNSGARLQKMAESIASHTRNAKRNDRRSMESAIAQWEQDLAWLKSSYYDGHYDFPWPDTDLLRASPRRHAGKRSR